MVVLSADRGHPMDIQFILAGHGLIGAGFVEQVARSGLSQTPTMSIEMVLRYVEPLE